MKHELVVSENKLLRRIVGPKRDEEKTKWRKLHIETFIYSSESGEQKEEMKERNREIQAKREAKQSSKVSHSSEVNSHSACQRQSFMKPESSLPCPQQSTSYLYPELDEFNPHPPSILFQDLI